MADAFEERLASLDARLARVQWVLGVGFSVSVARHLLPLNWRWQILQWPPQTP